VVIVSLAPFLVDASEIDVVTGDGATVRIRGNAAAQVFDPAAAATRVEDYRRATRIMFQTAIRSVVKKSPSAELPDDFSELEAEIKRILARALGDWGMSVLSVGLDLDADGIAREPSDSDSA
jgi:regulator of protease activity HflC (stomatin/prohibitin superfamily)